MDLHRRRSVHRHLRRVRDRSGGQGYGDLLVLLRTGGHFDPDPDRRSGHRHNHGLHRHRLRAKDLAAAAKHAPGEHLGVSGGRHREADLVHLQGGPGGGTVGRPADAACVSAPLRQSRDMDGPVPFRIRLLQRGLRRDGRLYRSLLLPDLLQRPGRDRPAGDAADRRRRHRFSDLGRHGEASVPA